MLKIFIFLLLFFFFINSAFAQIATTSTNFPFVSYNLPYPGLLPTSPLYKLKVLRDIVVGFFISDPAKKASYDLNLSDKRTFASEMLYDSGNQTLALDTISKAQNYFQQSIEQLKLAKQQGENIDDERHNLLLSAELRTFMLSNMKRYSNSFITKRFDFELSRSIELENQVNKL